MPYSESALNVGIDYTELKELRKQEDEYTNKIKELKKQLIELDKELSHIEYKIDVWINEHTS